MGGETGKNNEAFHVRGHASSGKTLVDVLSAKETHSNMILGTTNQGKFGLCCIARQ